MNTPIQVAEAMPNHKIFFSSRTVIQDMDLFLAYTGLDSQYAFAFHDDTGCSSWPNASRCGDHIMFDECATTTL
jgi:hypothetical protein